MQMEMVALIGVGVLAVVVVFLIPSLLQLKKTLASVDDLVKDTRKELTPILSELHATTERLNQAIDQAESGLGKAQGLFQAVGEVGDSVRDVHNFVRHDLNKHIGSAVGLWMGIKAAAKVVAQESDRRRKE